MEGVFGGCRARKFARRAALLLGAAVCGLVITSCGDQPTAPLSHHLRSGNASLSITPSFAPLPPGAPNIQLSKINGVLLGPSDDSILVTAKFDGDSAILVFDLEITGNSTDFTLRLTAFDMNDVVAYQSTQSVTVKPGDNTGLPTPVLVYAAPDAKIQTLHVSPSSAVLDAGESTSLSATGTGADGQSIPPIRLGWTSHDETVATVDGNGNVHAGAFEGSTWIVARTPNNVADSATVNVHAPVDHISVSAPSLQIVHGTSSSVTAQLFDAGNHLIDDRTAAWSSSDPSVATVSSSGAVQGIKVGTATLTAAAEGKAATVSVSVTSAVDHIDLTPSSLTFATLGQSQAVTAHVVARAGASVDGIVASLSSSNPFIATVDGDGKVTAMSDGSATITATADGVTATTSVTVKQVPASITVTPASGSVTALGDAFNFKATAYDAAGHSMPTAVVTWSTSDSKVASIDSDGRVVAGKVGDATITATDGPVSGNASFTASQTPTSMTVTADKSTFMVTQTATLTAHEFDANSNPITGFKAVWSTTTPSVATVTADGVVTGAAVGTSHDVATADGLTAGIDLAVTSLPSVTLTLSPASVSLFPSDTARFSATSSGTLGTIAWSVRNSTVGTVNAATGLYTAPSTVPSPDTVSVCASQVSPPGHSCAIVTVSAHPGLSPSTATVLTGSSKIFSIVSGGPGAYTWSVKGGSTYGTVSTSGSSTATFNAATTVPSPDTTSVCVSQSTPAATVCAHVTIAAGVTGRIVDASREDQPGIAGAMVTASSGSVDTTGTDGSFALAVDNGSALTISATGFIQTHYYNVPSGTSSTDIGVIPLATGGGTGTVSGKILDAVNGLPIPSATVALISGAHATADTVATATSDENGEYSVSVAAGTYTLGARVVGYSASAITTWSIGGTSTDNQNLDLSPSGLNSSQYRIVLQWNSTPPDLDGHLVGPKGDGSNYEIWYNDQTYTKNGVVIAQQDVDDTDGNGPETITINQVTTGTYRYYVDKYCHDADRSRCDQSYAVSGAHVTVYRGSDIAAQFSVPSGDGQVWAVFELNGTTGGITTIGTLSSTAEIPGGESSPGDLDIIPLRRNQRDVQSLIQRVQANPKPPRP